MAHYITSSDLQDKALSRLVDDEFLTLVDEDINAMALDLGVDAEDIEIDPLDHRIKEYAKCLLYIRICLANGAISPQAAAVGVDIDIYETKRKAYEKSAEALRTRITKELFTGEADTPEERVSSIPMYRG